MIRSVSPSGAGAPPFAVFERWDSIHRRRERAVVSLFIACLAISVFVLSSCNQPRPTSDSGSKRYHLTGRVISIDTRSNSVMIDGDDIPGFMSAMTMPYTVKDLSLLTRLTPGDQITADIVMKGDDSWLENIAVLGHSAPAKSAAEVHIPAPGEQVPDFKLTNQDGKVVTLRQYHGKALLLTFIYTRCPFPDFCPRISHQFAEVNRDVQNDAALRGKTYLLSISFDPQHDTPKVLRAYGKALLGNKQNEFQYWEFAAPHTADLPALAKFFALDYSQEGSVINHSLSTAVIGPDGRIFKWYPGSDWQPSDLLQDAANALHAKT